MLDPRFPSFGSGNSMVDAQDQDDEQEEAFYEDE